MAAITVNTFRTLFLLTALLAPLIISAGDNNTATEEITPEELMQAGNATIVLDVRTEDEFRAGHIGGAVNIDVLQKDFSDRVTALDRNKHYAVHCYTNANNGRADKAIAMMRATGFEQLSDLSGGYKAWVAAGGEPTNASDD